MSYEVKKRNEYRPMEIDEKNAISIRYLNRIELRKNDNYKYLVVEVRDENGGIARKSYFEPKISQIIKTQEDLEKAQGKFNGVMQSLTKAVIDNNYETTAFESFEDFCLKVISDIPKSGFSKPLRVKCLYDKKGNPTLPMYGVVFEDPAIVPKDKSRIKIFDNDVFTKVEMDTDAEKIDLSVEDTKATDDLPFDM